MPGSMSRSVRRHCPVDVAVSAGVTPNDVMLRDAPKSGDDGFW